MKQAHIILSNAGAVWVSRALMVLPQLFLAPYLLREVGEIGYGVYAMVWGLLMSIEQLQRSLQSGVVKYSAGLLAEDKQKEVNKVISTSFVYSFLLAIIAFISTEFLVYLYDDPTGLVGSGMDVLCISLFFIFPLTPYIAVIQAKQRFYVSAISQAISKYISLAMIVLWFHYMGPSVEALLIIMAIMLFVSRIIQVPFAYRYVPALQNKFSLFDKQKFKLICSFGAGTVLASICLAIDSAGVRWLMGAIESPAFVGHLAIILMPGLLLAQVIGPLMMTLMPATSAYKATGNHQMLNVLLGRGMRYGMVVALLAVIGAVVLMKTAMGLWLGSNYQFLAPYASVFLVCEALRLGSSPGHHMLKGIGNLRSVVWIYWVSLVIVPITSIVVIFYLSDNAYLASVVGLCLGRLLCAALQVWVSARSLEMNVAKLIKEAFLQPIGVASIACGICVVLMKILELSSVVALSILTLLASIAFLMTMFQLCCPQEEKEEILSIFRKISSKFFRKKTKV